MPRTIKIEALGIGPENEDVVHQQFLNKIQIKNARYEVEGNTSHLASQYSLSCVALGSLIREL